MISPAIDPTCSYLRGSAWDDNVHIFVVADHDCTVYVRLIQHSRHPAAHNSSVLSVNGFLRKVLTEILSPVALNTRGGKIRQFREVPPLNSQKRNEVCHGYYGSLVGSHTVRSRSSRVSFDDL